MIKREICRKFNPAKISCQMQTSATHTQGTGRHMMNLNHIITYIIAQTSCLYAWDRRAYYIEMEIYKYHFVFF